MNGATDNLTHDPAMTHEGDVPPNPRIDSLLTDCENVFRTRLTPMQEQCVRFMVLRETEPCHAQLGGLNCSPLGTGKTLMTLACVAVQKIIGAYRQKTLIVAPASVVHTWANQIDEHFQPGVLRALLFHGPNRRSRLRHEIDIVITSYGTLVSEYTFLRAHYQFDRVVLDEAHTIRNPATQTFNAVNEIDSAVRWCITATPVWNTLDDLWPLLHFIRADPLCHRISWLLETKNNDDSMYMPHFISRILVPRLKQFLIPITLRANKELLNLPPKVEMHVNVAQTENEALFYQCLYEKSREKMTRLVELERSLRHSAWARLIRQRANMGMMNIFLRMRQACVHPQVVIEALEERCAAAGGVFARSPSQNDLFQAAVQRLQNEDVEENCSVCYDRIPDHAAIPCGHRFCGDCFAIMQGLSNNGQIRCPMCRRAVDRYDSVDSVIEEAQNVQQPLPPPMWPSACSKFEWILADMNSRGADVKFVIFSQWVKVLDQVGRFFDERGLTYLRLDGTMSLKRRDEAQRKFRGGGGGGARVLLVSLMAGGQGLNLQRASVVYHLDAWWTASRTDQASNRVYRLGQTRDTTVVHLLAENTLEQSVFEIQSKKRALGDSLFSGAGTVQHEIRRAFQLG